MSKNEKIKIEADYILECQYFRPGSAAHGAINNIYGEPNWIVPEQNALAILGLIEVAKVLNDPIYFDRAQLAADYLARVQDSSDGAWFDQYDHIVVSDSNKSSRQTAKVMIALNKLGYFPARYANIKKAAQYLMSCQSVAKKNGKDDGLLCAGKNSHGGFLSWRWTHDNAYGYWAFKAASEWAALAGDTTLAVQCTNSSRAILAGIDECLYDTSSGVWHIAVDENDVPLKNPHLPCLDANADNYPCYIQFVPQMLDLPARGVNSIAVGEWIYASFQDEDNRGTGCLGFDCRDGELKVRKYPGFAFQAALSWIDIGQLSYAKAAINWAEKSSFWQKNSDLNGISGSWINWAEVKPEPGKTADWWLRYIETSFYSIACWLGGYDFSYTSGEKIKYSSLTPGYTLK